MRVSEGLFRVDQHWPVRVHWQRRGRACRHMRFQPVAIWRIEAGAWRNVRVDRVVVRLWRFCVIFGHDRVIIVEEQA
jgi:hypothetical protein